MQGEETKLRRGTIIKIPDATPGIVIIDGAQRTFQLEGIWASAVAPAANQAVDATLDAEGVILTLSVVDPRKVANERLEQFGGVAQEQGKVAAGLAKQGFATLAERMGRAPLIAAASLWVAWFFLPALNMGAPPLGRSITFWEVLGFDPDSMLGGVSSHGLFALLGLCAIAAPFAAPFWRHARSYLLYAAPLLFTLLFVVRVWWALHSAAQQAEDAAQAIGGGAFSQMAGGAMNSARDMLLSMVSLGYGGYVILAASGFLAFHALRQRSAGGADRALSGLSLLQLPYTKWIVGGLGVCLVLGMVVPKLFDGGLNKSHLAEVIDAKLATDGDGACWSLQDMNGVTFPITVGGYQSPSRDPIIMGLQKLGLVTVSTTQQMFGSNTHIDLTPKGKSEQVWDAQRGFCVGQRRVEEVLSFTEPRPDMPVAGTHVRYTWKLKDRPDWAEEAAFASVPGMTKPQPAQAVLQQMNGDWQVLSH